MFSPAGLDYKLQYRNRFLNETRLFNFKIKMSLKSTQRMFENMLEF